MMAVPTAGFTATAVLFSIAREEEPPFLDMELTVPLESDSDREQFHDAANAAAVAAYQSMVASYPGNTFTLLRRYEGRRSHEDITPS